MWKHPGAPCKARNDSFHCVSRGRLSFKLSQLALERMLPLSSLLLGHCPAHSAWGWACRAMEAEGAGGWERKEAWLQPLLLQDRVLGGQDQASAPPLWEDRQALLLYTSFTSLTQGQFLLNPHVQHLQWFWWAGRAGVLTPWKTRVGLCWGWGGTPIRAWPSSSFPKDLAFSCSPCSAGRVPISLAPVLPGSPGF